jgi:hypothetical protein
MKTLTPAMLFAFTVLAAGCASAPERPVLYPNAHAKQVGDVRSQQDVGECMAAAENAGVPAKEGSRALRPAAEGAAVGGAVGAVSSVIRGGGNVVASTVGGAAIGGTAGGVHGAFKANEVNPLHRNFVQRCLHERGYEVIGWK